MNFETLAEKSQKIKPLNDGEFGADLSNRHTDREENGMLSLLQILIAEQLPQIALEVVATLEKGGYQVCFERIETLEQMTQSLDKYQPDIIIISDTLAHLSVEQALNLVKEKGLSQPIILLCNQQRETQAIAAMKQGVADYIVKENLGRLTAVITRELRSFKERQWHLSVETALRASENQLRAVFNGTLDAMMIVNNEAQYVEVNQAACRFFGLSKEELVGRYLGDFCLHKRTFSQMWDTLLQKKQLTNELRMVLPDGNIKDIEFSASANLLTGLHLTVLHDITERKQAEDQLLYHAFYDSLTGLPNRTWFINCLARSMRQTKRTPHKLFAVLLLDLDRYQLVKYSFGHLVADQLLIATARRVGSCLTPKDIIARLGADEFAILLCELSSHHQALEIAHRLHNEFCSPFHLNECELFSTATIGIAPSYLSFEQPEDFLRAADTAMHSAKKLGGARSEVFETSMHTRAIDLLQLETDLRKALERQELRLYYQPIIGLATGTITGFEVLLRWQHPQRGFISPMEFITVAEDTGLIIPLGAWVLEEACQQLREWHSSIPSSLAAQMLSVTLNVNLSVVQFSQPNLIAEIDKILADTDINPALLKLEITETVIMEAAEPLDQLLAQLKARQIQLCIDDFGTGYSSLSRLQRLPIDMLKIDKSFVSRMGNSTGSEVEIVRACIDLAHNLGMRIVAEGVETVEQLAILRSLGCEFGQGFLFSKPVDAERARGLLLFNPQW